MARLEAHHPGRDHRLHLDLGRLRHGRDRGRPRGDTAGRPRGSAHRRRHGMAGVQARHGAAPRAGPVGRVHHPTHQRPQGVRHRHSRGPAIGAGRCQRDRARDVADVVRRRERFRPRLSDRRLPLHPRHPNPGAEHPSLPEGSLMATAAAEVRRAPVVEESVAAKIVRVAGKAPVQLLLVVVGLMWLVPTLGLFLTSLFSPTDVNSLGWWEIFSKPSLATFQNYRDIWHDPSIHSAFFTTIWIAIGGTVLPIVVAASAGYAFAWLDFPGRDWLFVLVIALLVVPLQMALIPMFRLYSDLGIFDTVLSLILFHTAFGLPFAIFLLRNFFIGIPKELLEAARIDGASELRIFLRLILPLGLPAIASLGIFQFLWTWNDLIVALTFGRTTRPITVAILSQLSEFGSSIDIIAPASFISLVLPLAVFFAFQRYFVRGLLAGSVKWPSWASYPQRPAVVSP